MAVFRVNYDGSVLDLAPGENRIGRMNDCWLVLDDELVSRYHAQIRVEGATAVVEDLGSRNGTYVNGMKLTEPHGLRTGDRVKIGHQILAIESTAVAEDSQVTNLRRTMAAMDTLGGFNDVIGPLIEKALKVGKTRDAERYAMALMNQVSGSATNVDHPGADSCVRALMSMASNTGDGVWIDRLFQVAARQRWVLREEWVDEVRDVLDRIPRMPGLGLRQYEAVLAEIAQTGQTVPSTLRVTIAELADAYG